MRRSESGWRICFRIEVWLAFSVTSAFIKGSPELHALSVHGRRLAGLVRAPEFGAVSRALEGERRDRPDKRDRASPRSFKTLVWNLSDRRLELI